MAAALKSKAALLLAAAALAACGGDEDGEEATRDGETDDRERTDDSTTVELDEFAFSPSDVTIDRGETITAENVGTVAHNLTIERPADTSSPSEALAATSTFAGGQRDGVRVNLPPGRYGLVCTVANHRQLGMVGTLTVR